MSFVRALFRDLVEKRLWPVALLMVIALVAIPVVLGSGAGSSAAGDGPFPPVPANTAAPGTPAVQLIGPPSVRRRPGKVIDPFRRPPKPAPATSSSPAATATAATGQPTGATSGTTSGPPTTGGSKTPDSKSGATPHGDSTVGKTGPSAYDLAQVADVRFGKRGTTLKEIRNLAPLSSLPSEKDPIVLFAGALKKRDVARFFITASSGRTTGSGTCKIRDKRCISVDMTIGDQQLFRVNGVEYELDLIAISSVKAKASSSASRTTVRFTGWGADRHSMMRLRPLGGSANPALLYLGVYSDGKRAVFVLGPHATATSEGACIDGDACRILGLRKGKGANVQVTDAGGSVRRYTIHVTSVASHTASADVSGNGRDTLRMMIRDRATANALSGFRYAPRRGVITHTASA